MIAQFSDLLLRDLLSVFIPSDLTISCFSGVLHNQLAYIAEFQLASNLSCSVSSLVSEMSLVIYRIYFFVCVCVCMCMCVYVQVGAGLVTHPRSTDRGYCVCITLCDKFTVFIGCSYILY